MQKLNTLYIAIISVLTILALFLGYNILEKKKSVNTIVVGAEIKQNIEETEAIQRGLNLFNEGNYEDARNLFEGVLDNVSNKYEEWFVRMSIASTLDKNLPLEAIHIYKAIVDDYLYSNNERANSILQMSLLLEQHDGKGFDLLSAIFEDMPYKNLGQRGDGIDEAFIALLKYSSRFYPTGASEARLAHQNSKKILALKKKPKFFL